MAQLLTDDDELELDGENKAKRLPPPEDDTISGRPPFKSVAGLYPSASPESSIAAPTNKPTPAPGAASPSAQTVSEAAPYTPAPRPESKAFTDWQAQDLAKHPVGQPRYTGLTRVMDTIAGATGLEKYGEFGTQGAMAKRDRLAGNAADENTQIGYSEKERQTNALEQEEEAKAQTEKTGSELVDVKLPDGTTTQVMRKNLASPTSAIINTTGREDIANTNADARRDVANINADAKVKTANTRQPIKVMGDGTYEKQADGNWKLVGPAPARAEQGNYVPINDEQGNTTGWVNPKSHHVVKVDEIQGMSGEGGAAPAGVIPHKPTQQAANSDKSTQDSLNYATQYRQSGHFTGPGDEALMEQFFNVAKPSSGFRMSQPQIDMLVQARSWMNSAEGEAYHAATGTWFAAQQRNDIIDTMEALARSKGVGGQAGGAGTPQRGAANPTAPPKAGGIPKFGDFVKGGQ